MMVLPVMPDLTPEDAEARSSLPLYRTYAPAYPHYFKFVYPPSSTYPPNPKVFIQSEDDQKEEEIMEDSSQKLPPQPFITPSYYPVYHPLYQPLLQQKQVLSSFRYPLTYPGLTYYPGLLTSPSSTFTGVSQPAPAMDSMEPSGGVLPSETLEGEEESAALLL